MISLLQVLGSSIKVPRAEHFHTVVMPNSDSSLNREGIFANRKAVVRATAKQNIEPTTDVSGLNERRGGVYAARELDRRKVRVHPFNGMSNDRDCARMIVRQFGWAHERGLGAEFASDISDFSVVRGDDNAVEEPAIVGCRN